MEERRAEVAKLKTELALYKSMVGVKKSMQWVAKKCSQDFIIGMTIFLIIVPILSFCLLGFKTNDLYIGHHNEATYVYQNYSFGLDDRIKECHRLTDCVKYIDDLKKAWKDSEQ